MWRVCTNDQKKDRFNLFFAFLFDFHSGLFFLQFPFCVLVWSRMNGLSPICFVIAVQLKAVYCTFGLWHFRDTLHWELNGIWTEKKGFGSIHQLPSVNFLMATHKGRHTVVRSASIHALSHSVILSSYPRECALCCFALLRISLLPHFSSVRLIPFFNQSSQRTVTFRGPERGFCCRRIMVTNTQELLYSTKF